MKLTKDIRHNYLYNMLDAGFFGFALGFASFITILPLFVSRMTNLQMLVGLVPSIRGVGWQLPQLFTARLVARQKRLKPLILLLTLNERLPFLGLALIAWNYERLGNALALGLTFVMLIWSGLGSGVSANAWQSLMAKLFPLNQRGSFLGWQAAGANGLLAISAVFAGRILHSQAFPFNFATCFLLAFSMLVISWIGLAQVREEDSIPALKADQPPLWQNAAFLLRRDANFRQFLLARNLSQFAAMSLSFYAVYAVQSFGMDEAQVGILTGLFAGIQVLANPLLGQAADRSGPRNILILGMFAILGSTLCAWFAQGPAWFYAAYLLAGISMVSIWTIGMAYSMQFGSETERPTYIGMSNTLTAPSTILAPFIGGVLIDLFGYPSMFLVALLCGLLSLLSLLRLKDHPRPPAGEMTPLGESSIQL